MPSALGHHKMMSKSSSSSVQASGGPTFFLPPMEKLDESLPEGFEKANFSDFSQEKKIRGGIYLRHVPTGLFLFLSPEGNFLTFRDPSAILSQYMFFYAEEDGIAIPDPPPGDPSYLISILYALGLEGDPSDVGVSSHEVAAAISRWKAR